MDKHWYFQLGIWINPCVDWEKPLNAHTQHRWCIECCRIAPCICSPSTRLPASLPVILCRCHSNHLTFPSQSRPNETTGGHTERRGGGRGGRCRHRGEETYITARIGSAAIVLYLSFAHQRLSLLLSRAGSFWKHKKKKGPQCCQLRPVITPHHKFTLLPGHFHINPITLSLVDNYPALHDLWPQTQIKIQLKVKVCAACSTLLSGSI